MLTGSSNSPFEAVRIPEFRLYIIQRFFFIMAVRMMGTIVLFKMTSLTDDPLLVAFLGLSEAIPAISLALYSGHVVDKSDKRTLLFRTILLYLCCAGGLLVVTLPSIESSAGKSFVQYSMYAFIFCTGVIRAFSGPTSASILAQLVPRINLPNAVTWSSGTWLTASVIGHASAGFLIVYAGYTGAFIVIMTCLLVAAVCMFRIERKPVMHSKIGQKTWESVKEGLKYVLRTKELLGALTLDMFAVLFGGIVVLIPFFTTKILHVSPIAFGWLNAAADIGSIISIMTLTIRPLRGKQGKVLLYVVAGFGISIITFGLSEVYWLSFVALLASGVLDGISVVIRGTILQLKTPDEMRGRVSSVNSMFINSSNEIGQVESGVAARFLGLVPSVVFGGAMTLLVVIITWIKAPTLRKFQY
jgi:predicted MFS family arabinose efflux permease